MPLGPMNALCSATGFKDIKDLVCANEIHLSKMFPKSKYSQQEENGVWARPCRASGVARAEGAAPPHAGGERVCAAPWTGLRRLPQLSVCPRGAAEFHVEGSSHVQINRNSTKQDHGKYIVWEGRGLNGFKHLFTKKKKKFNFGGPLFQQGKDRGRGRGREKARGMSPAVVAGGGCNGTGRGQDAGELVRAKRGKERHAHGRGSLRWFWPHIFFYQKFQFPELFEVSL